MKIMDHVWMDIFPKTELCFAMQPTTTQNRCNLPRGMKAVHIMNIHLNTQYWCDLNKISTIELSTF